MNKFFFTFYCCAFSFLMLHAENNEDKLSATFTVNTTDHTPDDNVGDGICADANGNCSLYAAIEEANQTAALDNIHFAIPGGGVQTINYGSTGMPWITAPVVIDGATQGGGNGNLQLGTNTSGSGWDMRIVLNSGTAIWNFALNATSGGTTIRNLVMQANSTSYNIYTQINYSGLNIENCFFNMDASGTATVGQVTNSIYLHREASNVNVSNNVFNNYTSRGVYCYGLTGYSTSNINVNGNFFGTDVSGMNVISTPGGTNRSFDCDGHFTNIDVTNNLITSSYYGIEAQITHDGASSDLLISGNYVGVNALGQTATNSGGGGYGIITSGSGLSNVVIQNNLVGNFNSGIFIGTPNTQSRNNRVGVNFDGDDIGNSNYGIQFNNTAQGSSLNNDISRYNNSGVGAGGASNITITNCNINYNDTYGGQFSSVTGLSITNSTFNYTADGIGIRINGIDNSDVSFNTIETSNNGNHGIALYNVTNLTIDGLLSNDNCANGTINSYQSILLRDCFTGTVSNVNANNNNGTALNIKGVQDISFTNLTLNNNANRAIFIDWNGLTPTSTFNLTFTDVFADNSGSSGIYIFNNNNYDITFNNVNVSNSFHSNFACLGDNITVNNSTFDGSSGTIGYASMQIYGMNTTITNCTVLNATSHGIAFSGSAVGASISDCTIHSNASDGINIVNGADQIALIDNSIYNNDGIGIYTNAVSNNGMPIPEILAFDASNVTGWLEGFEPNTDYLIQYFTTSGLIDEDGEGEDFIIDYTVTTDANGNVLFTHAVTVATGAFPRFTATQLE